MTAYSLHRGRERFLFFALFLTSSLLAEPVVFRRPIDRVASLDPLRAATVCEASTLTLVYETPLEVDYYARPYRLKPGLCELPAVSPDGCTYSFKVRKGRNFIADPCFGENPEKGRRVTAHDLVYSLCRLADKANASSGMWIMDGVKTCTAKDDDTFVVVLKKPLHIFPWLMSMPYAAAIPHEAVKMYGEAFGAHPVGSGAYRLRQWRRNHAMIFERNATWPGWSIPDDVTALLTNGKPATGRFIDRIEFLVVDDESTRWLMFLGHQFDFLAGISNNNWDAVVNKDGQLVPDLSAKGIRLFSDSTLQVMYAGINMNDPILGKNKKLRQALNAAFDFPAWKRFLNGRILSADSPVPPGVDNRLTGNWNYAFNLEKAKQLMKEAGYPNGVDPKTDRRLELNITLGRATQDAREQAELMASFYERIGIRFEARYMTWDAYLKAVNEGRVAIFFLGWVGDYPDAENFLQLFHSKNVSPGANHGNYRNSAFDEAYEQAMSAKTPELRMQAWKSAQEIIREDCPWIFLHYPKAFSLTWDNIEGYKPSDFPYAMEKHLRKHD